MGEIKLVKQVSSFEIARCVVKIQAIETLQLDC